MAELKLSVAVAHFPYGGNGGTSSEHPDVRAWETETLLKIVKDSRVKDWVSRNFSDTPITMTRNRALREAKKAGVDVLVMIDSDQSPGKHADEPWFKPFWDEAFNFIYDNWHKGPRLVFAPYCGPPDDNHGENCYVFQWATNGTRGYETQFKLEAYTREQAAIMAGIQEAAAGPTGLLMMDLRLLDLIEPCKLSKKEVLERVQAGAMSVADAQWALRDGYCYYEWEDCYADKKASTEDVVLIRDISLAGIVKLGYNPVFCAWDSWIGHWKPWNVGKPRIYTADRVAETLKKAVLSGRQTNEVCLDLSRLSGIEAAMRQAAPSNGQSEETHVGNGKEGGFRETNGPWHAHGHAPKEQQDFLADRVRARGYETKRQIRILEVGTWLGATAIAMADAHPRARVHCIDTWEGSPTDCTGRLAQEAGGSDAVYAEFLKRIGSRLDKTIFPFQRTSAEAAAMHWEPFDIIFIDAEHTYEACKSDILCWWPHLRDDGVMIGHDFETKGCDGVTRAVKELFGNNFQTLAWHPQGCMWAVDKAHAEILNAVA